MEELVRFRFNNHVIRFTGLGQIELLAQDTWVDVSAPNSLRSLFGTEALMWMTKTSLRAIASNPENPEQITKVFVEGLKTPEAKELGFSELILN